LENDIEPRSLSNKDYTSPEKVDHMASDERSSKKSDFTKERRQVTSMSVQKMKQNHKNNSKSEKLIQNNTRNRSNYSNYDGYRAQNEKDPCEKCEVVQDA